MSKRSQLFQVFPWPGGVNTSVDPTRVPSNQVVQADNIILGPTGSKKKREGIDYDFDDASNDTDSIIKLHDFHYDTPSGSGKTHRIFGLTSDDDFYVYESDGSRTTLTDSGTAYSNSITCASTVTYNNAVIICTDGASNQVKRYKPSASTDVVDLPGSPPDATVCGSHLGRLWLNDKDNLDRLHYSPAFDEETWGGTGDSGAIDVGQGDGDPDGITAIFPTFKGELFVAKRTKLYRIAGSTPATFSVVLVSDGIGCTSHNSIAAVDQDDLIFQSTKGFHSIAATERFGDFESSFISDNIQGTFNNNFPANRLKYSHGTYIPSLNSYAVAITDNDFSATQNKAIWLYNIEFKAWYRWADVDCESMVLVTDSDRRRPYLGTSTSRVAKTLNSTNSDTDTSGTSVGIDYTVKTGFIYTDSNPYIVKAFKYASALYKPENAHQINISAQIDGFETQQKTLTISAEGDLLGSTFILGTSVLNPTFVLEPRTVSIDGYGRGIQLTFSQEQTDQELDIQGFSIEWEPASTDYVPSSGSDS
jgi:hypothetical protein